MTTSAMNADSGIEAARAVGGQGPFDREAWNRYLAERAREWHERAVQKEAVAFGKLIEKMSEGLTGEQIGRAAEWLSDER